MKDEKVKEYLMELLNFPTFDKEAFHEWQGMLYWHDLDKDMDCLTRILSLQYAESDVVKIFETNEKGDMVHFLNQFVQSKLEYEKRSKKN